MNIRTQLTLLTCGGVVLSAVTVTSVLLVLERREVLRQALGRPAPLLAAARRTAEESALAEDPLMTMSHLRELLQRHPELRSARFRIGNLWLRAKPPQPRDPPGPQDRLVHTAESAVFIGGKKIETAVELVFSKERLLGPGRRFLAYSMRVAAVAVCFVSLLGIPLAFYVSRLIVRPIETLEAAANGLARGEAHTPLTVRHRNELGQLTAQFNRMGEKLKELDVMKQTFLSSVSHDLKSPLSAIESSARFLAWDKCPQARVKDHLRLIESNATKLRKLVSQLLRSAQNNRGMLEVSPRLTDVGTLVRETVVFFMAQAQETGITLAFELPDGKLPAHLDPERITQVLYNLLGNALKFTPAGQRITVYARRARLKDREAVEIGVQDSGPGIAPKEQERIFKRFERLKGAQKISGSGLGLSIAKSIVEVHGGTLAVDSTPGKGSRFYFVIPAHTEGSTGGRTASGRPGGEKKA